MAVQRLKAPLQRPRRRYTLYTALLATGLMLALYLLLGVWPFGGGTIVTGDLGGLYINFYAHLKRFLLGEAGFAYGFDKGLGGNLTGLFAYYYASPYNLLYLLFPLRWFPVGASIALLAKIVLSCVTFRVYIAMAYPKLEWRSVALALCYGFMAYSFAYAQNPMWHDGLVMLPLVCLGIDRIVQGRPLTLYTVSLAVAIFSDFYIAFMICIFAGLYFFWRMLLPGQPLRALGWRRPLLRFGAGSLLAGGVCGALLLPTLANLNQNKGALFDYHFSLTPNFSLLRLPDRFVWGGFAAGDVSGQLPFLYCGILVLVLVVCYFISRAVSLREKLLSGGVLAVFLLSFWLSGLDTLWHGLKVPIWFPARYSFIFCFFMVTLAARALATKAAGKRELLLAGGILLAALVVLAAFPVAVSRRRLAVSGALVVGYVFLLLLAAMATSRARKRMATGLVVFAVAAELVLNAFFITRQFDQYALSGFQQFVDEAGGTVRAIQAADEDTGYRMAENYFRTLNDPMLLGYKGISHFASTQDGPAQSVLYNLGFRNYQGGGPYLWGGTAFADAVIGYRYLADSGQRAVPPHWQQTQIAAPYRVYQNPYAMPLLFTVPTAAPDSRTGTYEEDLFAFQNDFARLLGARQDIFTPVTGYRLVAAGGDTLTNTGAVPVESHFEITAEAPGWHYAYFTVEGYLLIPMLVNGNATTPYFSPEYAGVVSLGWLEAGQTATVQFLQHQDFELTGALFARLDSEALEVLSTAANENAGDFTVRDGHVAGRIAAAPGRRTLYTAIPYDGNWRATVNGAPAQPFMVMGGLLALPLAEGENAVELQFVPTGTSAGAVISIASLLLLAGAVAVEELLAKRRRKALADDTGHCGPAPKQ